MIRNLLFIIFLLLFFPLSTLGAVLYLEPSQGQYRQGDTFIVDIRIDTEGECINAAEVNLNFAQDILETVDFSRGGSIVAFWIKTPEINQGLGKVSFAGGIPAGYCGRLPGDPGESNLLGRIVFQVRGIADAKVEFLDTSQVLLNDGFGTPANLSFEKAVFTVLSGIPEFTKDEWQEELEKDKISPEPFKIEVGQDPSIFEGKYFIIFSTTDKQTGINYYEVKEGRGDWERAESPYLLEDQSLKGVIKVKAVDKAGNEQIVEYPAREKAGFPWIVVLIAIIAGIILWRIIKKRHP